jgi:hypothetical protein
VLLQCQEASPPCVACTRPAGRQGGSPSVRRSRTR